LRTIGKLVTTTGAPVNASPTTDVDIYTLRNGTNRLVGVSGRTFFTIDLATQTTPATALGTQRNVVVQGITMGDTGGKLCDLAAAGTQYQSENGVQGGGNKVDTSIAGFVGIVAFGVAGLAVSLRSHNETSTNPGCSAQCHQQVAS